MLSETLRSLKSKRKKTKTKQISHFVPVVVGALIHSQRLQIERAGITLGKAAVT